MNYIKEINSFYDWLEINSVSDSAITLWYALMHINNKSGWKGEFTVAISTLMGKTSLSKSSVIRARNQLKQLGRIDFKERKGNQSCAYSLIAFHTDTQSVTQCDTQSVTQSVTQTDTINKLNKTKLNNILLEKESKEQALEFSQNDSIKNQKEKKEKSSAKKEKGFSREDFKNKLLEFGVNENHIEDWFKVRVSKRAQFTETSLNGFLNECQKNNFPIHEAVRICAEKSWQGFKYQWVLNDQQSNGTNQQPTGFTNSATKQPYVFNREQAMQALVGENSGGFSQD